MAAAAPPPPPPRGPRGPFLATEPTGPLIMVEVQLAQPDAGGGAIPVHQLGELQLGPRVCAITTRHTPMRVEIPELEPEVDARAEGHPPGAHAEVRENIARLRGRLAQMAREAAAAAEGYATGAVQRPRIEHVDVATAWVHLSGRAGAGQLRHLKFFQRTNYIQVLSVLDIELSDAAEAVEAFIAAAARTWPQRPPMRVERLCVSMYNCNFTLTPPPGHNVSLVAAEKALRAAPRDAPTRIEVKRSDSDVALRAHAWTAARRATEEARAPRAGAARTTSVATSLELFPRTLSIRGAKSRAEVTAVRDAVEAALAACSAAVFPRIPRRGDGLGASSLAETAQGLADFVACITAAHARGEVAADVLAALEGAAAARLNAAREA
jgi:hypothetical protein